MIVTTCKAKLNGQITLKAKLPGFVLQVVSLVDNEYDKKMYVWILNGPLNLCFYSKACCCCLYS